MLPNLASSANNAFLSLCSSIKDTLTDVIIIDDLAKAYVIAWILLIK